VVRVGLVGAGIMGGHQARTARALPEVELAMVVDPDREKGRLLAEHVGAKYSADLDALPGAVDAVIVASPTLTHAAIGIALLEAGLDVLIEKPIAASVEEAKSLVAVAEARERVLMVGHVERFNPAVIELGRHVDGLIHVDVRRVGPFTSRVIGDVVLDLMIHDVDLVHSLVASELQEVAAITRRVRSDTEDIAACLLTFANGVSAALTASRVSQAKQRQIELTQRDNVVVADLLRQQVTIHRVEHAEYLDDGGARYRQSGVIEIPYLEQQGEPLSLQLRHFLDCVKTRKPPMVSGADGLAALATATRIRDQAVRAG
jgi:UDP-N-acetylglucosamine 3-dehydrogenase